MTDRKTLIDAAAAIGVLVTVSVPSTRVDAPPSRTCACGAAATHYTVDGADSVSCCAAYPECVLAAEKAAEETRILERLRAEKEEREKYPWSRTYAGLHTWQLVGSGAAELALYRLRRKGLVLYDKKTRAWRLR